MDNELFKIRRLGKSKFFLLSLFLLFMIVWLPYFDFNSKLRFSIEPGYYEDPLYLEIKGADNYRVYYTLDGTDPTEDSIPYEGEIYLEDATYQKNVYSARTDMSTGFYTDLIEEYASENPGYKIPEQLVDKCNIVKAAAFDKNGKCVDAIEGSYFIGFAGRSLYNEMWVVSLITDPKNLFDYDSGIYVTGKVFDEYRKLLPDEHTPFRNCWWWWDANYRNRGMESERIAHVEIFNQERKLLLSENCGIRVQGRGSRGKNPKSLNVYARKEYAGNDEFSEDIFGIGAKPHKFVIFSGGDDSAYKIKDFLVHSMEKELSFSTMLFQPAMLFLDGEFWGTYFITESYNADYINDHYGVAEEDVIMVKEDAIEEGKEEDMELYRRMRAFISQNDMSVEDNYRMAQSLIDMDSYIDYYASQIFIARCGDWPVKNEGAWRTRSVIAGGKYTDGRWRWMLFDVNSGSLSIHQVEVDTLADVISIDDVFSSLFRSDSFKKQFAERLVYIAEEVYAEEKIDRFIDSYLADMIEPVCSSNMRFIGMELRAEGIESIESIRSFLKQRTDYVYEMIQKNMGTEYLPENIKSAGME